MKLVAGLTHSFDEVAPTPGVTLPANYIMITMVIKIVVIIMILPGHKVHAALPSLL
jgi:hypothetical protein